jgi:hypothetical protein
MTPDNFSFHIVKIKPPNQPTQFKLMAHRSGTSLFSLFFYFGIIESLEVALEVLGFDENTVSNVKASVMNHPITPVGIVEVDDTKMNRLEQLAQI